MQQNPSDTSIFLDDADMGLYNRTLIMTCKLAVAIQHKFSIPEVYLFNILFVMLILYFNHFVN